LSLLATQSNMIFELHKNPPARRRAGPGFCSRVLGAGPRFSGWPNAVNRFSYSRREVLFAT
jgi:hypothetical protein